MQDGWHFCVIRKTFKLVLKLQGSLQQVGSGAAVYADRSRKERIGGKRSVQASYESDPERAPAG